MIFDPQTMDNAATEAENDLINLPDDIVNPMAEWWGKWYLKAGHKRLGRILVQIYKENQIKGGKSNDKSSS
jgi:hypothetical protein